MSPYFIKLNYEGDLVWGSKVLELTDMNLPAQGEGTKDKGLRAPLSQHSVQRTGSSQDPCALARRLTPREGGLLKSHCQMGQARLGTPES